jgi:hypothetical protein
MDDRKPLGLASVMDVRRSMNTDYTDGRSGLSTAGHGEVELSPHEPAGRDSAQLMTKDSGTSLADHSEADLSWCAGDHSKGSLRFTSNMIFLPSEAWWVPEVVMGIKDLVRSLGATGFTKICESKGGWMTGIDHCSLSNLSPLQIVAADTAETCIHISDFVARTKVVLNEEWIFVVQTPIRVADADGNFST